MSPDEFSVLLQRWSRGDCSVVDELMVAGYPQLRRLARGKLRAEWGEHTLQPTELVHEAFLRLFHGAHVDIESRKVFFRLMAVHMKHHLVDHSRRRGAVKRGGDLVREDVSELGALPAMAEVGDGEAYFARLDEALRRLAELHPRAARVIQERFFADLSIEETAAAVGISSGTVKREYAFARAWLARELESALKGG